MTKPEGTTTSGPRRVIAATAIAGTLLLGACATAPPAPTAALNSAAQAIATADRQPSARGASPELAEARQKLTSAHAAVARKDMGAAERLAMESRIDAELAVAKSLAAAAQTVNDEMKQSNEILAQEMQRTTGASK